MKDSLSLILNTVCVHNCEYTKILNEKKFRAARFVTEIR